MRSRDVVQGRAPSNLAFGGLMPLTRPSSGPLLQYLVLPLASSLVFYVQQEHCIFDLAFAGEYMRVFLLRHKPYAYRVLISEYPLLRAKMNKTQFYLSQCAEAASKSPMCFTLGAVMVKGGKVISSGYNHHRPHYDGAEVRTHGHRKVRICIFFNPRSFPKRLILVPPCSPCRCTQRCTRSSA